MERGLLGSLHIALLGAILANSTNRRWVGDMFSSDELAREYIRELLREEYDAFWAAAANAIVDLIERGYLR